MSQPSTPAVLGLFARTAFRRFINRSAMLKQLTRRKSKEAPARDATLHVAKRSSLSGRLLLWFLCCSMMLGIVMFSATSPMAIIGSVRLETMLSSERIDLSVEDYESLRTAAAAQPEAERAAKVNSVFWTIANHTPAQWQLKPMKETLDQHFKERGMDGFRRVSADSAWGGDLALVPQDARSRAQRAVALYLLLANVGWMCVGLALMKRSLSQTDTDLVWLFQFPVSRRTLFVARLVENVGDTPLAIVSAIIAGVMLYHCGATFWSGFGLAAFAGLSCAVAAAALRLIVEVVLSQKCSRKLRGAVVSTASSAGGMVLLFCMLFSNSRPTTVAIGRVAEWLPRSIFWNPLSCGFGAESIAIAARANGLFVASSISLALALAAVRLAAHLTAGGLATGVESTRGSVRRRRGLATGGGLFHGLVGKELLQLRRQPELLLQVLLAPVLMLGLLYLNNPERGLQLATYNAGVVCTSIFVGGAYLLMTAVIAVLRSELKTLWFLQCQPRSLADCIRTKSRVWGAVAIAPVAALIGAAIVLLPGQRAEVAARAPFVVAYVWLFAEVCFGVQSLGASIVSEQTIKFRRSTYFVTALLIAECGTALFGGSLWGELGVLVMLHVTCMAVRQKQHSDLAWLSEPVESPPRSLDLTHALIAVYGFLFVRDIFGGVLAHASLESATAISLAYCGAAVAVASGFFFWRRQAGIPAAPVTRGTAAWRPVLAGLAVTCSVGFVCVMLLQRVIQVPASAHLLLQLPSNIHGFDWTVALRLGMVALVAPVFEEWLFRGLLYRSLRRTWGVAISVAISALLFTAIHPAQSAAAVMTLAIVTAWVFERTGRLGPGILIHVGYNTFVIGVWALVAG